MSLPETCPRCGADRNAGRFCVACGDEFEQVPAPLSADRVIVGALAVYGVGQVLLLIEAFRRLSLLDGGPTYAHAASWLEVGVVAFWMVGVLGTALGLLQSGERRGRLLLAAVVSVVVAQSLDVAAALIQAIHITNLVPSGPTPSRVTAALATEWLVVAVVSFNLLSFAVAAVAFAGPGWVSRRSRRRRLVSIAFAIWAWAGATGIAAHLVLLLGTPVAGAVRTGAIEETVTDVFIVAAASLAALAFAVGATPAPAARVDGMLACAAAALMAVYVSTAVEYFTLGDHVQIDKLKNLYELHAWASAVSTVAAMGLCAALTMRRRSVTSD